MVRLNFIFHINPISCFYYLFPHFLDEQEKPIILEGDNIAPGTGIDLDIESESESIT